MTYIAAADIYLRIILFYAGQNIVILRKNTVAECFFVMFSIMVFPGKINAAGFSLKTGLFSDPNVYA